jgi:hypothetical protein
MNANSVKERTSLIFINWFLFRFDFEALSDLDKMRDDHNIHESGIVEILFKKVSFQIIGMSK